jgi:hypothetical protein
LCYGRKHNASLINNKFMENEYEESELVARKLGTLVSLLIDIRDLLKVMSEERNIAYESNSEWKMSMKKANL